MFIVTYILYLNPVYNDVIFKYRYAPIIFNLSHLCDIFKSFIRESLFRNTFTRKYCFKGKKSLPLHFLFKKGHYYLE